MLGIALASRTQSLGGWGFQPWMERGKNACLGSQLWVAVQGRGSWRGFRLGFCPYCFSVPLPPGTLPTVGLTAYNTDALPLGW